jgi:hypothetical protein
MMTFRTLGMELTNIARLFGHDSGAAGRLRVVRATAFEPCHMRGCTAKRRVAHFAVRLAS